MAQQNLLDPFLTPEVAPTLEYHLGEHTVAWRKASNAAITVEVFLRENRTYGFRYAAWVAWRDAGGQVQSHGWWRYDPDEAAIVDDLTTACQLAEHHAQLKHVEFASPWRLQDSPDAPSRGSRG